MLAYDFFHPNHIVPTPELIAAFMKFANLHKTDMAVKFGAVFSQVFVLLSVGSGVQIPSGTPEKPL